MHSSISSIILFIALTVFIFEGVVDASFRPIANGVKSWLQQTPKFSRSIPVLISALSISSNQPAVADMTTAPWDSQIKYDVVKSAAPDSPMPKTGDLVVVRFQGKYKDIVFDDTFKTEQPYFYRAGVGLVVKGLDDSIINMHVGDRIKLQFSGDYSCKPGLLLISLQIYSISFTF